MFIIKSYNILKYPKQPDSHRDKTKEMMFL